MNHDLQRAVRLHNRIPEILAQRNDAVRAALAGGVTKTETARALGLTVTAVTNIANAD